MRFTVIYEQPKTGRFTVMDHIIGKPAIGRERRPLTGLSHSTADALAAAMNAARSPPDPLIGASKPEKRAVPG